MIKMVNCVLCFTRIKKTYFSFGQARDPAKGAKEN